MPRIKSFSFVLLNTVTVIVVFLMAGCDVQHFDCVWKPSSSQRRTRDSRWATTQEQQALKGNGLWGCHGNESVMTQTVSRLLPQPKLLPVAWTPSPLHLPSYSPRCGSCVEVNWTRSFFESLPSHPPTALLLCPFFSFSRTHVDTHRQWSKVLCLTQRRK